MKKYEWFLILANLVFVLIFFTYSVVKKEILMDKGQLVLLKLAPVDPRSLMQGDYMSLRYAIIDNSSIIETSADSTLTDGMETQSIYDKDGRPKYTEAYCVVRLDSNCVATLLRYQKECTPLNRDEVLIKCKRKRKRYWSFYAIGAEDYFFQEGEASKYENAKFGGLKIDTDGNSILFGLYDKNKKRIE